MLLGHTSRKLQQVAIAVALLALGCGVAAAANGERLSKVAASAKKSKAQTDELALAKRRAEQVEAQSGRNSAKAAAAWQDYGDMLGDRSQHSQAIPIFRRVLAIRIKTLGESHADTAYTLDQLGWALYATEGAAAGEPFFRRVLESRERVLGGEHLDTIFSLRRLGLNLFIQSKYREAEPYLRREAEARLRVSGDAEEDAAEALRFHGDVLEKLGRYQEAIPVYTQAAAVYERAIGTESRPFALTLNNLAWVHSRLNQFPAAISIGERAAAIRERVLGIHADTALTLQVLSTSYFIAGRFDDGARAAERALAIREQVLSPDDIEIAVSLHRVALFRQIRSRFAEAEKLAERALAILEKRVGPDDALVAESLELLAYVNESQARFSMAIDFARRGLKGRERFGSEDANALRFWEALARNQDYLGLYAESEQSFRRVLTIREKLHGPDHVDITSSMMGLADGYSRQGRYREAELLYRRTLEIRERTFGQDHYLPMVSLARLGRSLVSQGRYQEAEAELLRCVEIGERIFGDHPFTAIALEDLASVHEKQGRVADAEAIYQRSIAMKERNLGPNHPSMATSLGSWSLLLWNLGRAEEAEAARARQLSINLNTFGPDHDNTASSYGGLAWVQIARGRWAEALPNYAHASDILIRRSLNQLPSPVNSATRTAESEIGRSSWTFLNYIRTAYWAPRIFPEKVENHDALVERSFELIQWAHLSDTSDSLSKMSLRVAPSDTALAARVREFQDLSAEWRVADTRRAEILSKQIDAGLKPAAAAANSRLEDIERRLTEASSRLRNVFPQYAELSRPRAIPVEEAQRLLAKDEALIHFSLTPMDCFVWIVTADELHWFRLDVDYRRLVDMVTAIRQQLMGDRFNLNLGYGIYQAVFEPFEKQISGKHLLIVPSGILTTLPLHLLLTEKPEATDEDLSERFRKAPWMAKRYPITVLPSVSSLKVLRQYARRSNAQQPYLGVGNPLLHGPNGDDRRAWELKRCADMTLARAIVLGVAASSNAGLSTFFRGGVSNIEQVRRLDALPETVAELCSVAETFGRAEESVVIGADADEPAIRRLSDEGALAATRIVHFATHGLVAGEIQGLAEPALVLTPPSVESAADIRSDNDGLLTASEIAQLKLDADWVVLSACNTAAGGASGAEALSGLARAFFYAGARALLVSHWMVNSEAAVKLIVGIFAEMARDPTIGRAEALRRAMTDIIDNGAAHETHPRYWAPFVVVGEGSAR